MTELLDVIHDICNNVDMDTTEGDGNMHIEISTSDADSVDPAHIATMLSGEYFVLSVSVNEGERVWTNPEFSEALS